VSLQKLREYLSATGYSNPGKGWPLLALALSMTAVELLSLALVFQMIQAFVDYAGFLKTGFAAFLQTGAGLDGRGEISFALIALFLAVVIVRGALTYFGSRQLYQTLNRDEAAFTASAYERLLHQDYTRFQGTPSSQIIRDIAIAIPLGFTTVMQALLIVLSETLIFLGIAAYLFMAAPMVFTGLAVLITLSAGVYAKVIGPVLCRLGRERHDVSHRTIGILSQSLEGVLQIKNWQAEGFFGHLFLRERTRQSSITTALTAMQNVPRVYFETIIMTAVAVACSIALSKGDPSPAFLSLLGFYVLGAFRILPSVLRLSAQFNVLTSSRPSMDAVIAHARDAQGTAASLPPAEPFRLKNALSLSDIVFTYGDRRILDTLSLNLRAGEMAGISGRSGEGKTTLVNVITGLLKPQSGEIRIDGQAVEGQDRRRLTVTAGYVPQNAFLLNDTVRANIAFGVPSDQVDDKKILDSLQKAQLEGTIATLPHALDTVVGERGGTLSGGERQRVGIARALYFDRDILILDEATAALDMETEAAFCAVLNALKGLKTVIVISHRPGPLAVCDTVYEMRDGKLWVQA